MRVVMFYHSLVSDWNHGNAHFLRGVVSEMISRGIDVRVYEPQNGWSLTNLIRDHGDSPIDAFHSAYPQLSSTLYEAESLDLDFTLEGADVVIVHEWNDNELVRKIGEHHSLNPYYSLLFHDTHHRAVTDTDGISKYDLTHYHGVLAFGEVIQNLYLQEGWTERAWTWHEAADTRVFYPHSRDRDMPVYDLVWIGNWGDDERTAELYEFLIEPISDLGLKALVHGVRYPETAVAELEEAGIEYGGWLPNLAVSQTFAQATLTVHIPRRPYVESLPGIPTIRPFEALACGIPLISAYWEDKENLFSPGEDFVAVRDGKEMKTAMQRLLVDGDARSRLIGHGLNTIRSRHTCGHRVDQLLHILEELKTKRVQRTREKIATV